MIRNKIIYITSLFFIFFSFFGKISLCDDEGDNKQITSIEADYTRDYFGDKDFLLKGNVILKLKSFLINADEIEIEKEIDLTKEDNKTKKTLNNLKNLVDKNDFYIFKLKNWVKLRTKNNDFIFSKNLTYHDLNNDFYAENVQVFPNQRLNDTAEIYAKDMEKKGDEYIFNNITLCPCKIFSDKNILDNKKVDFDKINKEEEIIKKPLSTNSIDNTHEEMSKELSRTSLLFSIQADKFTYFADKRYGVFEKVKFKFLTLPVFYLPKWKVTTDTKGTSGILMPGFMFLGTRQVGIEIPVYFKFAPNIDLYLSATPYIEFGNPLGIDKYRYADVKDNRYKLKDLELRRNHTAQFRFRHLINTKYNYENYYTLEAMFIYPSQLVNDTTGLGVVDDNGNIVKGLRYDVSLNMHTKLTNTTFLVADISMTSDKNIGYYYQNDNRLIQENKIHLYDVSENRYFSAELYNYQPGVINIDNNTIPLFFPVIRGYYEFNKDKIGGKFYINAKGSYINRKEGYSTGVGFIDIGYNLPIFLKKGTKITIESILRGQYENVQFKSIEGALYDPLRGNIDNLTYYFGNYQWLSKNNNYGNSLNKNLSLMMLYNFNRIQVEHPFVFFSTIGKTIINPKIAFRYSPNHGRNILMPVEDDSSYNLNYYNAFRTIQSDGYGVYDIGASMVYGFAFNHKFEKNKEIYGGLSHNLRLTEDVNINILPEYSGFRKRVSDLMGYFGFRLYGFKGNAYFNYDFYNKEIRFGGIFLGYKWDYFSIYGGYNYYSKNATIFEYAFDTFTVSLTITPIKKFKVFGGITANFKNLNTIDGIQKPGIVNYNFGTAFTLGCFELGFIFSKSKFALLNLPTNTMLSVLFNFIGW